MRNKNRIFRVAAVQMNSREDVAANLAAALRLIDLSADAGAEIVALPENFLYIGPDRQRTFSRSGAEIDLLRDKSRRHGLFILAGSILERTPDQALPVNTSLLINPDGEIVAEYQKIHLFDAELPGGESHRESAEVLPGDQLVVAETPSARIGLTLCYDLRFPELYRRLALRGAQVIFVPSNFTLQTGKDHWLTLLRARAIENTVYLVAPAQIGAKADNRASFGKAAVIDPWGTVIALAPERDEFAAVAEIDLDYLDEVRRRLPTLKHVRLIDAQD